MHKKTPINEPLPLQATITAPRSRLASRESGEAGATMAGVEDFIRNQWPLLRNRVADLENKKRLLEAEMQQVEQDLATASQEFAAIDSAAKTLKTNLSIDLDFNTANLESFNTIYRSGDVSIKQAIRLSLDHFRDGLSSQDLYRAINRRYFEGKLKRESFSPQLSRLHAGTEVTSKDHVWVLTNMGRALMDKDTMLPYRDDPDTNEPPSA